VAEEESGFLFFLFLFIITTGFHFSFYFLGLFLFGVVVRLNAHECRCDTDVCVCVYVCVCVRVYVCDLPRSRAPMMHRHITPLHRHNPHSLALAKCGHHEVIPSLAGSPLQRPTDGGGKREEPLTCLAGRG
jgi:hypothetical protein